MFTGSSFSQCSIKCDVLTDQWKLTDQCSHLHKMSVELLMCYIICAMNRKTDTHFSVLNINLRKTEDRAQMLPTNVIRYICFLCHFQE